MSTDLQAGAVLLAGPAAATEVELASLLLTASAAALTLTTIAIELIAVLGVVIWVAALLVLVAVDASRAVHRRHMHQQDRNLAQLGIPKTATTDMARPMPVKKAT